MFPNEVLLMMQTSPEIVLNQLMLFMGFAMVFFIVLALLVEYNVIRPPLAWAGGRNKFTKNIMLLCIFVFYAAMIIGVFYALSSGIMTVPDLDPFTMRSAFDTISLMLIVALFVPFMLMFLLRAVVKHK